MTREPDITNPDPVAYLLAWIEYAKARYREKLRKNGV